jgi:prepilin-type processing-associated H-X9-DG protein
MLLPALEQARQSARRTVCTNNLKNVGLGFTFYADASGGAYPAASDPISVSPFYWLWMGRGWRGFVAPHMSGNLQVLYCPSDATAPMMYDSTSYGYSMALYHSASQINAMTDKSCTYSNPQPPVGQNVAEVKYPSRKVLAAEWLSNHQRVGSDPGWWGRTGTRNLLFCGGHVLYISAVRVAAANDGLPDFNLTVDGSRGRDVE